MAKTKTEEKNQNEGQKLPQKKNSIRYPFYFVEKNYNKKSSEGSFQKKIQTAKTAMKTDTGKSINQNIISGPLFETERRTRRETAINTSDEINPKKNFVYGA